MMGVVLSRPPGFKPASLLIRWATSFEASHASIQFIGSGFALGERMVLEAVGQGIVMTHHAYWDDHNTPIYVRRLKPEHKDAGKVAVQRMFKALGADYDFKGLFHFGLRLLLKRLFGIRIKTPETPGQMFCSELVARWLIALRDEVGCPGIAVIPPDETSPADLLPMMDEMGIFEEVPPCELSSCLTST